MVGEEKMSAIISTKMRVLAALNFKNEPNIYVGIGRAITPWTDENNPPTPVVGQTEIEELVYIKKIGVKHLVIVDDPYDVNPVDVQVAGVDYNYVDDADAFDESANRVYLSTSILFSDIAPSSTTFRQIGLLIDPKNSSGELLTDGEYLAADVADQGELVYIDNISPITRDPSQSEKIENIILF